MKNFVKKNWSKILIFVGIVCIIFIVFSVIVTIVVGNRDSKEVVAPGLIWSGNQGVMNWDKAVATCNSLGDRLPNHKELSIAPRETSLKVQISVQVVSKQVNFIGQAQKILLV